MTITASVLRNNIYRMLDNVIESGKPLTVKRKGQLLRIIHEPALSSKLSRLTPHDCIKGDPDELVHLDWSREWKSDLP